ncbi:hypothetical protein [Moorena producens]|nr:hypothetical protein [Moorena producens]
MQSASGGNHGKARVVRSYRKTGSPCLDAVAHGGNHGSRSWFEVTVR